MAVLGDIFRFTRFFLSNICHHHLSSHLKLFQSISFVCCSTFNNSKCKMLGSRTDNSKYVLTQRFNPIIGKAEWETQDEDYDFHQEIARAAYADMLHDVERNQKYLAGLTWAVSKLRAAGRPVHVLDIGTGTGLLSMMAARLGADEITACEAFEPISKCAKQVIEQNGFGSKIHLIPKRSTEIIVGPDGDMKHRANLLITEVFDTELIGEGAIYTFNHAHEHLLEKGSLVVPSIALVYAQVVESDFLWHWNQPRSFPDTPYDILVPEEIRNCRGSPAVLDIQLSRLPMDAFKIIANPALVAKFDFTGATKIPFSDSSNTKVIIEESGRCSAVLFWWDLHMDDVGNIKLSCAPWWHHEKSKDQPWRDHWMQAVYFPSKQIAVQRGDNVILNCSHDEYSFWFDVLTDNESHLKIEHPICTCGYHVLCNRNRIGMIGDINVNAKYIKILKKVIKPENVCVFVGNAGSLLPLLAAKVGAKQIFVVDTEIISRNILMLYIKTNNLSDKIKILDKNVADLGEDDFEHQMVDVFISEPFFLSSLLPWDNLHAWYIFNGLSKFKAKNCKTSPIYGKLWAVGIHFLHLWKIKAPLYEVEGFKMQHFDTLIQNSSDIADQAVEPQPLWEYEGIALTNPFQLFNFDLTSPLPDKSVKVSGHVPFSSSAYCCNGVALWMDWHLDSETCVSRGPVECIIPGKSVKWDLTSKQGVYFFTNPPTQVCDRLLYNATFASKTGQLEFHFDLQ